MGVISSVTSGSSSSLPSSSTTKSSSWADVAKFDTPTPSSRTPSRKSRESSIRTASWEILSGKSVAPVRVTDRDQTVKSAIFALRVTVRANCPDFFNRPHTKPA